MNRLTKITRIGTVKRTGSEYSSFIKKISLSNKPSFASIRLDAVGVCGIFINGTFLEAVTGRYANRVAYFECTSLLNEGENTVALVVGGHYYQPVGDAAYERSGAMFSSVAAEISYTASGSDFTVVTDSTWECDNGVLQCFSEVTEAEYHRFWLSAALWHERKPITVSPAVSDIAGEEYLLSLSVPNKYTAIDNVLEEGDGYKKYGLEKLHVGYVELEYDCEKASSVTFTFDYTENASDLDLDGGIISRLKITEPLKCGRNTILILRRRAFRYIKIATDAKIIGVRLIESVKPYSSLGYFRCEDELLNRIWQVGKYTLLVNKHQEYESCPRNEMKFFSGDAIIEALTDHYVFGDSSLVDASFALTEIDTNLGIRHNRVDRNVTLWDYPAWRILIAYNQYKYFKDTEFIKKYYSELKREMLWLTDKMNSRHLIYQFPCFSAPMYAGNGPVEYNSSPDRLGEKPLLNALLYKCLLCMNELAGIMNDPDEKEYLDLAYKVKDAVNEHLFDSEKGAYLDLFNTEYIPEDGNAVAALFGLGDEARIKTVLKTLKERCWTPMGSTITDSETLLIRDRLHLISPVMNMYEAEARFKYGDEENALELIRACWGSMINKGAETFWEFVPSDDTRWHVAAHGWASGCTYLLSAYVLGIRPSKAGYEEMLFAPSKVLDNYKGVVPTPRGNVAVRKQSGKYTLVIPKGVRLVTEIKNIEIIEY